MAAAYLFHIVRNHPFVDGNKRVGAVSAIVFLRLNDQDLNLTERRLESLVKSIAEGSTSKAAIAEFLRDHAA